MLSKPKKADLIPFSFLPPGALKKSSGAFLGIGERIGIIFPALKLELGQSGLNYEAREYGAIMVLLCAFYFALATIVVFAVISRVSQSAIAISPIVGGIAAALVLVQLAMYPKIIVKRRVREIERNLVFALRTIAVQLKSGVSLFDSMKAVAEGNYGLLSEEFRIALEKTSTGTPQEEALEEMASKVPSQFFRRSIWQIVSGLKAGANITSVMEELVATMTNQQAIGIRKYGSDLKLLSLMYMMLGVIIPSLGITFMIVLSSFPQVKVTELLYWGLLGGIVVGEFMFIGIMKSKRPSLLE